MSLYGFEIPHHKVRPVADKLVVRFPYPPKKIGNIWTPDNWRELAQHSHQTGIIHSMGPLAFEYKNADGQARHAAKVGDWVLVKWGSGTNFVASKGLVVTGGWRYLSSFNDVVGVIDAQDMPDPTTLCWDESETALGSAPAQPELPPSPDDNKLTDEDIARRLGSLGANDARADGFSAPAIIRGS